VAYHQLMNSECVRLLSMEQHIERENMSRHIRFSALVWGLILVGSVSLFGIRPSFADTASVLTKGLFQFKVNNQVFFNTTKKYNQQGKAEPLATNFNILIDGSVFDFSAFGSGSNVVGSTVTNFEWELFRQIFQMSYGVTDKFTVGIRVPWVKVTNKVKFSFNNSGANIGILGAAKSTANPCGFFPIGGGGTIADTAAAQQCLQDLGFKKLQTFQGTGFEDIELEGVTNFIGQNIFARPLREGFGFPPVLSMMRPILRMGRLGQAPGVCYFD